MQRKVQCHENHMFDLNYDHTILCILYKRLKVLREHRVDIVFSVGQLYDLIKTMHAQLHYSNTQTDRQLCYVGITFLNPRYPIYCYLDTLEANDKVLTSFVA